MLSLKSLSSYRRLALTLLAVGSAGAAITLGSLAAWSDQTTNPGNTVTAGTLDLTNDKDGLAVFTAANVAPGDSGSDTVELTNAGSIPMAVSLTQDQLSTSGIESSLRLSIHDAARDYCYYPVAAAGPCASRGAWDANLTALPLANAAGGALWPAGEAHTFNVSWELVTASTNADQGKVGSFRLVWDAAQ